MNDQPKDYADDEWNLEDVTPEAQAYYAANAIEDVLQHADALGILPGARANMESIAIYLKRLSEEH